MNDVILSNIDAFFSRYRTKRIKKGQIIIYAGDAPSGVYHIKSGKVRQYDINYRGDEIVVNVFKSPAFFPMSWAINKGENRYFFEAMTDVELQLAPADEVVDFLKAKPDVMYDLLSRLYSGVDGLQRRMAHLMGGSARSRILFELIIECSRFGTLQGDGSYLLLINEGELAKSSGLSRETANRELGKLKSHNLVAHQGKALVVKGMKELQEALGNDL